MTASCCLWFWVAAAAATLALRRERGSKRKGTSRETVKSNGVLAQAGGRLMLAGRDRRERSSSAWKEARGSSVKDRFAAVCPITDSQFTITVGSALATVWVIAAAGNNRWPTVRTAAIAITQRSIWFLPRRSLISMVWSYVLCIGLPRLVRWRGGWSTPVMGARDNSARHFPAKLTRQLCGLICAMPQLGGGRHRTVARLAPGHGLASWVGAGAASTRKVLLLARGGSRAPGFRR